jgi:hypothetical protein
MLRLNISNASWIGLRANEICISTGLRRAKLLSQNNYGTNQYVVVFGKK